MQWRMQAKGYSPALAWFWETSWVYGIGLLGFGVYWTIAQANRFLGIETPLDIRVFHFLAWGFYLAAHLPDVFRSTKTPYRWWNAAPPLLIAGVNISIASLSPHLLATARTHFSSADPILFAPAVQIAIILSAYLTHGLVNLFSWCLFRLLGPKDLSLISARRPAGEDNKSDISDTAITSPPSSPIETPPPSTPSEPAPQTPPPTPAETTRQVPASPPDPNSGSERDEAPEPHILTSYSKPHRSLSPLRRNLRRAKAWFALRRLNRRSHNTEPLLRILDYLKNIPPKDITPTLRFVSRMAMGITARNTDTVLLEAHRTHLFHSDGRINAVVLTQCLSQLPHIYDLVPRSRVGRTVYRPIARNLRQHLGRIQLAAPSTSLNPKIPALQRCLTLIANAKPDETVQLGFVCAKNINRSRTMQKIMAHLIRSNGLGTLFETFSAGAQLSPGETLDFHSVALTRNLDEQNRCLARLGIHESDSPPISLSDVALRQSTVVFVASPAIELALTDRLRNLLPENLEAPAKIVPFITLDPHRFEHSKNLPDPHDGETTVEESVLDIYATLEAKLLPLLHARAVQLAEASHHKVSTAFQTIPNFDSHLADAARNAVMTIETRITARRDAIQLEHLTQLLWALAHRDATVLLLDALPKALEEIVSPTTSLPDHIFAQAALHLPYLKEVVPHNRHREYADLSQLLESSLSQLHPSHQPRAKN